MGIKVHDVVYVEDTDNNEEWLGYCAGFRLSDGQQRDIRDAVLVLVQRRYGMGAITVAVPLRFCS